MKNPIRPGRTSPLMADQSSKFEGAAFRLRLRDVNVASPLKSLGQSLVEVVVAVGLIMVTATALLSLAIMGMKGAGFGVTKAKAVKLANEEMELVRAYRDATDWGVFNDRGSPGVVGCSADEGPRCYIDASLALQTASDGDATTPPFNRYFSADPNTEDEDKYTVTVYVTWTDQSGEHVVRDSSIFTNWR